MSSRFSRIRDSDEDVDSDLVHIINTTIIYMGSKKKIRDKIRKTLKFWVNTIAAWHALYVYTTIEFFIL